jgi:hypothetical protein
MLRCGASGRTVELDRSCDPATSQPLLGPPQIGRSEGIAPPTDDSSLGGHANPHLLGQNALEKKAKLERMVAKKIIPEHGKIAANSRRDAWCEPVSDEALWTKGDH